MAIELHARPRTVLGKKVKAMRRSGLVPANIYGHRIASQAIEAPVLELRRIIKEAGRTNIVSINLEGEGAPRMVLIRKVQRKPTTDALLHVDFQEISMRERMQISLRIILTGRAPVLDLEGVVVQALDSVDVECLPGDIPQHLEVDQSSLTDFDSHLKVGDLHVPANVELLTDPDIIVASVTRSAASEAAEEEAAEAEAAAEAAEAAEEAAPAADEEPSGS